MSHSKIGLQKKCKFIMELTSKSRLPRLVKEHIICEYLGGSKTVQMLSEECEFKKSDTLLHFLSSFSVMSLILSLLLNNLPLLKVRVRSV
ncbi:hypothetical protein EZS27_037536 [termite gut metagenome]|uniref:Uncharacterized protein n=1 Tax=termite gut metagenome TaxID=433724 RepID=A0A5J4PQZ3_9ZZZZ